MKLMKLPPGLSSEHVFDILRLPDQYRTNQMSETGKLFKGSFIIFVGTFIASIFSYLFNMLMGRMLGPNLYGDFSALLSLSIIVSAGGTAILTIAMKYSGELAALANFQAIKKLFSILTKYVLIIGFAVLVIGLVLIKPISNFLSVREFWPIAIILSSIMISLVMMVNKGILQGTQKFREISILAIFEMVLRLLLGISLVYLGLSISGAALAMVLATLAAYILSYRYMRRIFKHKHNKNQAFEFDKKEIIGYSWPTLITTVFLAIFMNLDILLVKHYFAPFDAGVYAAISTVAKIIFYLTGPIVSVMFPLISEKMAKEEKHYSIFMMSFFLTLALGIIVLIIYAVVPHFVMRVLYGSIFVSDSVTLLASVGIVMLIYALINLILNYFMALKNFTFLWLVSTVLVLELIVVGVSHGSIFMVVRELIFCYALLLCLLLGYYLITKKSQIIAFIQGRVK